MLVKYCRAPLRLVSKEGGNTIPLLQRRLMASAASDDPRGHGSGPNVDHTSHQERTANEPRAKDLHTALITKITTATKDVRLIDFRVQPPGPFNFKAGQWVDTFTPASPSPGGFSIVSAPAQGQSSGTFRLAIQRTDRNPPAAWLWRKVEDLEGKSTVDVRVGGQFTFPPVNFRRIAGKVRRVTLVAGGIGSNPMLSVLGALRDARAPLDVTMLYGIRTAEDALYLDELAEFCNDEHVNLDLRLFCSKSADTEGLPGVVYQRRMTEQDLDDTLPEMHGSGGEGGTEGQSGEMDTNLYYVCGPAQMTDWVQEHLLKRGVVKDLVQTERWW